jgi:GTP-binding protein
MIGDTLCPPDAQDPLPAIKLEEPTISMTFGVNNSPFAGKEGKFVTSRQIATRLEAAAMRDVALQIATRPRLADTFEVKGRGVMHLGVLAENMRREGYEFAVGKPRVILKEVDGVLCEPMERTRSRCRGRTPARSSSPRTPTRRDAAHGALRQTSVRLEFRVPARGLIGARTAMMTMSKGEAILSHMFDSWRPTRAHRRAAPTACSSPTARATRCPTACSTCSTAASSSSRRARRSTRA